MMNNEIQVGIKLDDKISSNLSKINKNLQHTRNTVDNLNNSTNNSGKIFKNVFGGSFLGGLAANAVVGAFNNITNAIGSMANSVFENYSSMQQFTTGITTMMGGDAQRAQKFITELSKLSEQTPFEMKSLQKGTLTLQAFGFEAEKSLEILKQIGDISSLTGSDLSDFSRIIGQIRSKGKMDTMDSYQMANLGFGINDELKRVLNVNGEELKMMIEQGKIGIAEVEKAISAATGEGGKFYKAMEEQAKTVSGQLSNLKDKAFILSSQIGKSFEPLFLKLINFANKIMDRVKKMDFTGISNFLSRNFTTIENFVSEFSNSNNLRNLKEIGKNISEVVQNLLPTLLSTINKLSGVLLPFLNDLTSLLTSITAPIKFLEQRLSSTEKTQKYSLTEGKLIDDKTIEKDPFGFKAWKRFTDNITAGLYGWETVNRRNGMPTTVEEAIQQNKIAKFKEQQEKTLEELRNIWGAIDAQNKKNEAITSITTSTKKSEKFDTLTSQQPKIVNVNILSGDNSSLVQKLEVQNIIDKKSGRLTEEFKSEIENYFLDLIIQAGAQITR